ncbi:MAG TPA: hypothetical protein VFY83_13095 [Anaerolineales bacterium]|nr:hypothetical protein [Anaerolineales bacterium]
MTILVLILSILLGTVSLAMGYLQGDASNYSMWFLLLGALWLVTHFRKWYWFSSIALLAIIFAAAYGVWREFPTIWMLLGALGGLLGWDLSDFARRLSYASPMDDTRSLERIHMERVGIVAALGFGLAILSVVIRVERLPFEIAVALVLLAALGLTRLVIGLRRY